MRQELGVLSRECVGRRAAEKGRGQFHGFEEAEIKKEASIVDTGVD